MVASTTFEYRAPFNHSMEMCNQKSFECSKIGSQQISKSGLTSANRVRLSALTSIETCHTMIILQKPACTHRVCAVVLQTRTHASSALAPVLHLRLNACTRIGGKA